MHRPYELCLLLILTKGLPIMFNRLFVIGFLLFNVTILTAKEHPFLFLSKNDIGRIQKNVKEDIFFKKLAEEKIARAKSIKTQTLPAIDNLWHLSQKGKGYINEIDRQITFHNQRNVPLRYGNSARDLALAYVLTEDEGFAVKAKSVLLMLSSLKPVNISVNCGLDYSVACFPAIEAYDLVYNFFDDAQHKQMKEFFFSLVKTVRQCSDYWIANEPAGVAISNHDGWHHVCFAMVGLFYSDQELIDRAISGPKGFEVALKYGFEDDGIWLEASLPYHFVQLSTMLKIAEMSYNSGYKDLYTYNTDDGLSLSQLYASVIELAFPDGMLPSIGDGYGKLYYPSSYGEYELLYQRTGDERFAYLLNMNEQRSSDALLWGVADISTDFLPDVRSRLWVQHGFAALRTQQGGDYWKGDGYSVFASFSHNTCHHHADGLSIQLFADGHLWLRDSECKPDRAEAFGSDVNKQLNWTTLSHNTVLIDGKSQEKNPKPLDLIEFTVLPEAKRLCMGDLNGHLYEGVRQLRTLIATDDYVLDVFEVDADSNKNIAWITHVDAHSKEVFKCDWSNSQWQDISPWNFLKGKRYSEEKTTFYEKFSSNNKLFQIDVLTTVPAKYIQTDYPVEQSLSGKHIPMRMIEASSTEHITFVAVYRSSVDDQISPIKINIEKGIGTSNEISLQFGEKRFSHRVLALQVEYN